MADDALQKLTTAAQQIAREAVTKQENNGDAGLGVHHWLEVIFGRYAVMAQSMATGLEPAVELKTIEEKLHAHDVGPLLDVESVVALAYEKAQKRGRLQAAERDLITVVLERAGYRLFNGNTPFMVETSASSVEKSASGSYLEKFGKNLTENARQGKLPPVVGRSQEITQMIEILCRRTKRNPVLVGPAGVGKTAIVEALAMRIVQGDVPAPLKNVQLYSLQPSNLVAGASISGELEKRVQAVVREASRPDVILFIDEIHTIIGAGGMVGTTDMGSILKPSLARGEIACIAATTQDEYRRFIENDSALERRFNPVRVNEPTLAETVVVVKALRDDLSASNHVSMDDGVLEWLVEFADHYMRNRHFPDKAVDLMEQCYAHALTTSKTAIDLSDAQMVAQRMIGMPLALETSLEKLQQSIQEKGLLNEDETGALSQRLQVTMRGLDMRSSRPNAIILLVSQARERSEELAQTIAESIYGNPERVITIDFNRFLQPEDINLLVGAPPGYVGYADSLPLHRLAQTPWCVLRFENVDACHPYIRQVLSQALKDGWLMDGRGRPMYLSDAIVLLTADITLEVKRGLGFFAEQEGVKVEDIELAIRGAVGEELASQMDMVLFGRREPSDVSETWLQNALLDHVNQLYLKQGVELVWDESVVSWLVGALSQGFNDSDWEAWVDHALTPAVIPHLPRTGSSSKIKVSVRMMDGALSAEKL